MNPAFDSPPPGMSEEDQEAELDRVLREAEPFGKSVESWLVEIAYRRLHLIARGLVGCQAFHSTLGPTALVNEGFVRMFSEEQFREVKTASHFYARFTKCMQHTLVDHFRSRTAKKRGGGVKNVGYDVATTQVTATTGQLGIVEIADILESLASRSEHAARAAKVFELHFFGGLKNKEIAQVIDRSESTVESLLRYSKAYIRCQYDPN